MLTGALIAEILPPPRNAPDESLNVVTPVASTGDDMTRVVSCPATLGLDDVTISFGERINARADFPRYGLRAEYAIDATRVPQPSGWLIEEYEARGLGAVMALACAGGFFPRCEGDPFVRLPLEHPMMPSRDCKADGCPDFVPFRWDATGAFDLRFEVELGMSIRLLDETGQTIAEAAPMDEPGASFQAEALGPEPVVQRLAVPDLPVGFYVLVVTGAPSSYVMQFLPPPGVAEVSLEPKPGEVEEPRGKVTYTVRVRNNDPQQALALEELADSIIGDLDGRGTCQAGASIPAAGTYQCSFEDQVTGRGGTNHTRTVRVSAFLEDGRHVARSASATVAVADVLPLFSIVAEAEPSGIPETGGPVTVTSRITNLGTREAIQLSSLEGQLWQDADGDGERDGDEETRLALTGQGCSAPQELAPGATSTCQLDLDLSGNPWADPVIRIGAAVSDDEANRADATAEIGLDMVQTVGRGVALEDSDLDFRLEQAQETDHNADGYFTVPAQRHEVVGTFRVRSDADEPVEALAEGLRLTVEARPPGKGRKWQALETSCLVIPTTPIVFLKEQPFGFVCPLDTLVGPGTELRVEAIIDIWSLGTLRVRRSITT